MSKPVVAEIGPTCGIVRSVRLFAVCNGAAVVIRNGADVAVHITWVRIARIILVAVIVALVLTGDGSAYQRPRCQGSDADPNAIPPVTVPIAAMPMTCVTMTNTRMACPVNALRCGGYGLKHKDARNGDPTQ